MSYIVIQNKGELPLWGVRLLGYSSKDESKIGRFGTGLKETIALLTREGTPPIFQSGTCLVEFSVQEQDGMEEICFRLSEPRGRFVAGEWHPMGLHRDFGKHDWSGPWMVLREIFCNAVDASGREDLYHDVVPDLLPAVAGCTRAYIKVTEKLMVEYSKIGEKLLMLSDNPPRVEYEDDQVCILEKSGQVPVQIYHRRVWIQEGEKSAPSLFDYELPNIKLTESRTSDWYGIRSRIAAGLLCAGKDVAAKVIDLLLTKRERHFFEFDLVQTMEHNPSVQVAKTSGSYRKAFQDLHGPDAVICYNDVRAVDLVEAEGKKAIVVAELNVYGFLSKVGVPSVNDYVDKEDRRPRRRRAASPRTVHLMNKLWHEIFERHRLTNGREIPSVQTFERDNTESNMVGQCVGKEIFVREDIVGSQQEVEVLVEELAHYCSGAGDYSREMQDYLVTSICRMSRVRNDAYHGGADEFPRGQRLRGGDSDDVSTD